MAEMKNQRSLRVEILAIGSELLTPYRLDTNSLYLTERLNDLGFEVSSKTIVGDDWDNLVLHIRQALANADLILACGGLGPTADDRTIDVFACALERKLVLNRNILKHIQERFRRRGIPMPAANRKQAYLIQGALPLPNRNGTAPGQCLETGAKTIVLLPGPPHELKPMFEDSVWPRLSKKKRGFLERTVLKITGLTESMVETRISDLYPHDDDLKVTVLASPGQIEVHLTSFSPKSSAHAEKRILELREAIKARLQENIFSESNEELEEVIGRLLRNKRQTLAVAESCTGGLLSHRLTNVPGSSDYFLEGVIAYSNAAKIDLLGVSSTLVEAHGAVSRLVARAMARGIRKRAGADYGLAVTGIAGPSGGTPAKPVGLVYTALAWEGGAEIRKNLYPGKREQVKSQSSQKALDMLRRHLQKGIGVKKAKT